MEAQLFKNTKEPFINQIQRFVEETLRQDGIEPCFFGNKLHISEMVALDGGLVKLLQQALLIDIVKKSKNVWDNGIFIESNEDALTGYEVVIKNGKADASRYAILAMLLDSINTAVRLSDNPKTLELSNLPIFPVPAYLRPMEVPLEWDTLAPAFSQQEAEYQTNQDKEPAYL